MVHEYLLGQKIFSNTCCNILFSSLNLALEYILVKIPPPPFPPVNFSKKLSPLRIENEDFRFRCDTCGKMVRYSQAAFKNHLSLHETGKLACGECQAQGDQARNS
jgi:hypothetical protein